jgi:protein involved in polysaccharide export with SLBB domain
MDRIYSIKLAPHSLLLAGLTLFLSQPLLAQTSGSGLTTGLNTAPPLYPPSSFGGASAASLMNSMDALNDQTKLKAGDQLSYRVIEEQDPQPDILTVTPTGDISIPLLGLFPAAGKTCKQLALQLKPLLEKNYFYKATVIIGVDSLSTAPLGRVFLTGQVKAQGAIDIPPNEVLTVSRAILLDGGLADFADRRRIRLLHRKADGTTLTTVVDLKEILDRGHSEKDPVVQPGDTIDVPEKLINF